MSVADSYWGSYAHGRRKAAQDTEKVREQVRRLEAEVAKLKKENAALKKALVDAMKKD